ncbi:MAG: Arc family DNA-binding protein [Pseudomonadota bacterium]
MADPLRPSRQAEQFQLRLPDGLRDRISEAAKTTGRSMNSEIVARLLQTFEAAQPVPDKTEAIVSAVDQLRNDIRALAGMPPYKPPRKR